ncbi:hypothetical protein [Cytobacillus oceanisediminis]|uniref:hypothetical protein n=1 Tax=Cytobacillus oceanisediminis TaxID=665099 RepID=UPI001FB520B5|nr:hypothetical protein [Cytobacillus oceanisediminis]UOE58082.1 hypothetical protein IRB79_27860 [Cytobacillus oceanisediminis]
MAEKREDKGSLLESTVKAGAAVGGGIVAYRNRAALARRLSEATSGATLTTSRMLGQDTRAMNALSDIRTLMGGVSDALGDNPSVIRTVRAGFDRNIQDEMRRNFEHSVRNNIQKRHAQLNRPGQNKTTFGSAFYNQFSKRQTGGLTKFQYAATSQYRQQKIMDSLRKNAVIQKHGGDRVLSALADYHSTTKGDVFHSPSKHVSDFVKQLEEGKYKHKISFQDKTIRDTFQKTLHDTIQDFSDSAPKLFAKHKGDISRIAKGMESGAAYGFIKQAVESTSLLGKALKGKGFNPVKVSEAINWDEARKRQHGLLIDDIDYKNNKVTVDVTKEMQKFLDRNRYDKDLNNLLRQKGINFDFNDMVIDPYLLSHKGTGEVLDNRHLREGIGNALDFAQESWKVPFININPLDLTPWQAFRSGKMKEGLHVLNVGTTQGFLRNLNGQTFEDVSKATQEGAIRNPLNNSSHFYTGGNVFRFTEQGGLQLIDENLYIAPQFGAFSRMHKNMINYSELEKTDDRSWLKKAFDIGHQEGDSHATTYKKAWNKLSDPNYGPNALRSLAYDLQLARPEEQADRVRDVYGILRSGIERSATGLNREAAEVLAPHVNRVLGSVKVNGESFDFSRLSDDSYLVEALVAFNKEFDSNSNLSLYKELSRSSHYNSLAERESAIVKDPSVNAIKKWAKAYIDDPEGTMSSRDVAVQRKLPSPLAMMVPFLGEDETLTPAADNIRRAFHQYALRALDNEAVDFAPELAKSGERRRSSLAYLIDAREKGVISDADVKAAKDLELLTDLQSYENIFEEKLRPYEAKTFLDDVLRFNGPATAFDETAMMYAGSPELTALGFDLQEGILRAQPKWGRAPEPKTPAVNGADFIIMRKSQMADQVKQQLSQINFGLLTRPVDDAWDVAINAEMFARDAVSNVLSAGKVAARELFAGRRANGDSLENVTTTTAIMYGLAERLDNQFTNFGLGLSRQNLGSFQSIIGNQYLRRIAMPYMAYQQAVYFDGLTGDTISDTAADAYVNTHETIAMAKDLLGINKAMRPWSRVFQNAGFDQMNEWVGVKQLDFMTFGMFTDFRSAEQVRDYYESGEDPVRKNRYWGVGSPTPWAGSGIEYYRPNWYRQLKSDYKFTDTMYGSESEYWSNHWMPTLTNPLAPIRHFITDPYHYEKKHEADRPYAVTGGFSEIQNIPLVGNLIDGTVGRILKPRREHDGLKSAHREYLAAINDYIDQQRNPATEGAYVGVSQSGGITTYDKYGSQGTWGGINPIDPINGMSGSGPTHGAGAGVINYGNFLTAAYKTPGATGSGGYGTGYGAVGAGSGASSEEIKQLLAYQNYELALQGKGTKTASLTSMLKLNNKQLEGSIGDIERLDSLKGMALDSFYSASELSGIYGFLTKTGMGYEESWRGTTLASSSLMTSPNRAFWDMSLGGMGGALSEIGRRYVPRDPNKNYYSPIRNTMPDWLPGIESSVDFLHGDPYVKIKQGEMRLPGEAYERFYNLHPDGTGQYGIFDRFRILADIDPDSDQYKVAKHEVSLLRQSGGMTPDMEKEYDEIIDQVRSKEDTMRWYDKKFSNAEIEKKSVTVTKIVDANTFMVREFDSPIRLAGVKLTKKDNQDAIDWLGQFIKPGEKLEIGISANPADRYNQDTYETMSAVVYANKNEEGRFWFETNKGQSLNAILANRTWKNPVQIKDNGSSAATNAIYSRDMITVGKYMEALTHDILPKVPFVGVLADKFLQVRTPIESYRRDQVYGSDWRPWTEPYQAWIKPMLNTVASQNPLLAGAELAAIGHLWGKSKKMAGLGRVGGFAIGAGLSSLRVFDETVEGFIPGADGVWIPKERETEREINEYFDRLKYVKYRGLYEKTRKLAMAEEGVDVNEFFDEAEEKGRRNKGLKRFLTDQKKLLSLAKKTGYGDLEAVETKIDDLSSGIDMIDSDKEAYQAGKYTALAIQYRKEYESTLYGMDGSAADRTALMRALTPKEREYVPRFLETTSAKERKEILKYVPKDIKRILQGSWGMDVDSREDIDSYFKTHYLPEENWSGWNAGVNLDDIKIKVMRKEGVNPTNSGYWQKDQDRADRQGEKAIPMNSLSSLIDVGRIREVLQGAGLSDVDVQLTRNFGNGPGGVKTSINVMRDVHKDVLDTINESVHSLF